MAYRGVFEVGLGSGNVGLQWNICRGPMKDMVNGMASRVTATPSCWCMSIIAGRRYIQRGHDIEVGPAQDILVVSVTIEDDAVCLIFRVLHHCPEDMEVGCDSAELNECAYAGVYIHRLA